MVLIASFKVALNPDSIFSPFDANKSKVLFSFQKHFFFQIIFNHDMAATPSLFKAVPDHSRQCIPGMVVR
jgi:hypothetical protein